jgi:osmotically-inducible protein OsmY
MESVLTATESRSREVETQVREALAASPIQSHHRIRVEQAGNTLYLHGRVESFYYKQLAQEAVRSICRGIELQNELDVQAAPASPYIADY